MTDFRSLISIQRHAMSTDIVSIKRHPHAKGWQCVQGGPLGYYILGIINQLIKFLISQARAQAQAHKSPAQARAFEPGPAQHITRAPYTQTQGHYDISRVIGRQRHLKLILFSPSTGVLTSSDIVTTEGKVTQAGNLMVRGNVCAVLRVG
jgi:hypothetical protein